MFYDCARGAERRGGLSPFSGVLCSAKRRNQRMILGGKFLIEWIRKHGQAFHADELARAVAIYGTDFIHHAAVSAGADGCRSDRGFLCCGSAQDSLNHGSSPFVGR